MAKKQYVLPIVSCICVLAVVGMILMLTLSKTNNASEFQPPAFDSSAQSGMPTVDESLGWSKIYQDGMSYTAYVCGNVSAKGKSADVYFTNIAENSVWLKLRILDESGGILGETGLVKPGEYVRSIQLDTMPKNRAKIKLKIMAYEPVTYYSAGSVALNTVISKEGEN